MIENANNNLKSISLDEIKQLIKKLNPGEFDKMIISADCEVQRSNYFYVNYLAKSASRNSMSIGFPLYSQIANNFSEFDGGDAKHGELAYFPSNKILDNLSQNFQLNPSADSLGSSIDFKFPLDVNGDSVDNSQRNYFVADRTFKEICSDCTGKKLVTCDDSACEGRHQWTCEGCNGVGQLQCDTCAGTKKVMCGNCNGNDRVKCRRCGGDGKVNDGMVAKAANSKYAAEKKCGDCQGRGHKPCNDCTRGRVVCSTCTGQGKVTCSTCSGKKKITCTNCYGDKERYGLIDCPNCKAQGEVAQISYVSTTINNHSLTKILSPDGSLDDVTDDEVLSFANSSSEKMRTVTNINDKVENNRDNLIDVHAQSLQNELGLSMDDFDKILEEELFYQVIPCVQIKYTHMLTNTSHEISVLNFFDSPKLKFHQEVELVKSDVKDKGKKVSRFFGKLLKTKKFKVKDDKKKEIKLMIYLAKADGLIEDAEKEFLSQNINSISEFTSDEKEVFFNLMNNPNLPSLDKNDVTFSSEDKFNEVILKLETLAESDGVLEKSEEELLAKIKSLK